MKNNAQDNTADVGKARKGAVELEVDCEGKEPELQENPINQALSDVQLVPPAGFELSRDGKAKTASSQADINQDINRATEMAALAGSDSRLKTLLELWEKLTQEERWQLIEYAERLANTTQRR